EELLSWMVKLLAALTALPLFCSCTVIGCDGWFVAIVCVLETINGVNGAVVTVTCCVVEANVPENPLEPIAIVTVSVPLLNEFLYVKLAELEPAAMVRENSGLPDESKNWPALELLSWTDVLPGAANGLPLLSCSWTVMGCESWPCATVCGAVVTFNDKPTLSCCCAKPPKPLVLAEI